MSNQLETLVGRQGWFKLRDMTGPESGRTLTGKPLGPPDSVSGSILPPEEPQPSPSATNDDKQAFVLPQHLETPSKRTKCGYRDVEDGRHITDDCTVYRREWFCKDLPPELGTFPYLPSPCPHLRMHPAFPPFATAYFSNYIQHLNLDPDFCTAADYVIDGRYSCTRYYCQVAFDHTTGRNPSTLLPCQHLLPMPPPRTCNHSPRYSPTRPTFSPRYTPTSPTLSLEFSP